MKHLKAILICLMVLMLVVPTFALPNYTPITKINNVNATPFVIWAAMGLLGLILFLYTLTPRVSTPELECSIAISTIAWFPIGFFAATAWAVDTIVLVADSATGTMAITEVHILQHYDILGFAYGVFFIIAIINTIRIIALHKSLRLQSEKRPSVLD